MDAKDFATVIKSVCARMGGVDTSRTLIRDVMAYCRGLGMEGLADRYPNKNERLVAIAESYLEHVSQQQAPVGGLDDPEESIVRRDAPCKAFSVMIDSRLRRDGTSASEFGFAVVPHTMAARIGSGAIQARDLPAQVQYMRIGRVALPYLASMRALNPGQEILLTFTGLRSNGMLGASDTYHFAFNYKVKNDIFVELRPVNKYCYFDPPLRYIDDLSLHFSDPLVPIAFPADRMMAAAINYTASDGRITFAQAHGLAAGDIVVVQGLTTLNDAANAALLQSAASERGHAVTVVTPTTISIGVDFSAIVSPDPLSLPLVLFVSRMFRFPIEMGHQGMEDLARK